MPRTNQPLTRTAKSTPMHTKTKKLADYLLTKSKCPSLRQIPLNTLQQLTLNYQNQVNGDPEELSRQVRQLSGLIDQKDHISLVTFLIDQHGKEEKEKQSEK